MGRCGGAAALVSHILEWQVARPECFGDGAVRARGASLEQVAAGGHEGHRSPHQQAHKLVGGKGPLVMRVGRTLPPAAAPIGLRQIVSGFRSILLGRKALDRFRSELKEYFGVKYCFLVCSGRAAFTLILLALEELSPGRKDVIIPAFTCYSVPSSVVRARLKMRLCDLYPDGLDFDFAQLSSMEPDTRVLLAVVPTHRFGAPSDVPRSRRLFRDPGVTIVEDAAQAMGESWKGRKLGTFGDVGFFSLGRGKAFSTVEGGVILTDRD